MQRHQSSNNTAMIVQNMPEDICKLIHDFARPSHKYLHTLAYRPVITSISLKWAFFKLRLLDEMWNANIMQTWTSIVDDYVEDPLHLAESLSKCTCCVRHQTNHPLSIASPTFLSNTHTHRECECPCRHAIRFMTTPKELSNSSDDYDYTYDYVY